MQPPSITGIVYSYLYPKPTNTDPSSFHTFTTRHIVLEVRAEVQCFYGPLETLESRYPGLDYTNAGHRLRLGRFPYHKKLFDAFDSLRLSHAEILALCRWEGTRWAKERFEAQEGIRVRDTTFDGIPPAIRGPPATSTIAQLYELRGGDAWHRIHMIRYEVPEAAPVDFGYEEDLNDYDESHDMEDSEEEEEDEDEDEGEDEDEDEDEDEEMPESEEQESEADPLERSIGVDLNQRLIAGAEAGAEARARGEEAVLDADWEQWLKEAVERGTIPSIAGLTVVPGQEQPTMSLPSWGQSIPDVFRYGPGAIPPPHISSLQSRLPQPPRLREQRIFRSPFVRELRPRPTSSTPFRGQS